MSLLLDDVSIVVTPNGYKAGTLYGVIPTYAEGADLVDNGDFALGDNGDWSKDANWGIANGKATSTGSGRMLQSISSLEGSANVGTVVKVTFDIVERTSGGVVVNCYGGVSSLFSTVGTHSFITTTTDTTNLYFNNSGAGNLVGSIDNVSVKEVTSSDMDVTRATAATRVDEDGLVNYAEILGEDLVTDGNFPLPNDNWSTSLGWSIADNKASNDGTEGILRQVGAVPLNTKFKVVFTVDDYVTGNIQIKFAPVAQTIVITADGTYTIYTDGNNSVNGDLQVIAINSFQGSVTNISVKEVTRDNVPRIDYTGGGCPHILAEPERTNLVTYSEAYGSGTYFSAHSGTTIDSTTETSPDGENAATEITSTGDGKLQSGGLSLTQNTDYVLSFYAKNVDATLVNSRVYATGGSGGSNLTSVDYTSQLSTTEWTRITHSFNTGTNTTIYVYLSSALNSGGTVQVWGAQLEQGSYATSYIPTDGGTVTRAQDIFTRDGVGSLINSTEGVLFVEMAALADDETNREITLSDGSAVNYVLIRFNNGGSNRIYTRVDVDAGGGVQYFDLDTSHTITDVNKIAIRWGASNFATFINGGEVGSQLSGSSFSADTLNELNFDNGTGGSNFYGKVKQLQVYDTALTDPQLISLTT
jgi:hypothetical protein